MSLPIGFDRLRCAVLQTPSLAYLVLRCADLSASRQFYEALGLKFVEEQHGTGPKHLSCDLDGVIVELYPGRKKGSPSLRFGLYVADVSARLQGLSAIGVQTPTHTASVVRDPDGNTVELLPYSTGQGAAD